MLNDGLCTARPLRSSRSLLHLLHARNIIRTFTNISIPRCPINRSTRQVMYKNLFSISIAVVPPYIQRQNVLFLDNGTIASIKSHHRQHLDSQINCQGLGARVLPRDRLVLDTPAFVISLVSAQNDQLVWCLGASVSRIAGDAIC